MQYAPAVEQLLEYGVTVAAGLLAFALARTVWDRRTSITAGGCAGALAYLAAAFLI